MNVSIRTNIFPHRVQIFSYYGKNVFTLDLEFPVKKKDTSRVDVLKLRYDGTKNWYSNI